MINWLKGLFTKKKKLVCGGNGCLSVTDNLKREVGKIWYRRPTSEEVLNYSWDHENVIKSEANLKEIAADEKNKLGKMHEILIRDLWLPRAPKIFVDCEGFTDGEGKLIDNLSKEKQLHYLETYYSHLLSSMVSIAFSRNESVKKKD